MILEYQSYLSALIPNSNLKTFLEALPVPNAALWKASMREELNAPNINGTSQFLPRSELPLGRDIIPGRWVYRRKTVKNGQLTRYKSRYVVKGFH